MKFSRLIYKIRPPCPTCGTQLNYVYSNHFYEICQFCDTAEENVICSNCIEKHHEKCRGGTWCPCQHREDRKRGVVSESEVNKK